MTHTLPENPAGRRVRFDTVRIGEGLAIPEARLVGSRRFIRPSGSGVLLGEVERRTWSDEGGLLSSSPVEWRFEPQPSGGLVLRAADPDACADLLCASREYDADVLESRPQPMTVTGSFEPLAGIATVGDFVVGGQVLDTNVKNGARRPSEQTALSLYRIARLRGGVWDAIADEVGAWTEQRILGASGYPVHGNYGRGETHMRFLADAGRLLIAQQERTGVAATGHAVEVALDAVEALSVEWNGGRWLLHDTVERDDGRNDLVLNTHLQAIVTLIAGGRDVRPYLIALDHALRLRPRLWRDVALGVLFTASGNLRGRVARLGDVGDREWRRTSVRAGRARVREPHVAMRNGFVARDATAAMPPHYLTANLLDLAALHRQQELPAVRQALRAGLRHAILSGYFDGQLRTGDRTVVLVPAVFAACGRERAAARWAARLSSAGIAPTAGWPGFTDRLWSKLAAGTP